MSDFHPKTPMEEIREAAIAYYQNQSYDSRLLAWNSFQSTDANKDGKVSYSEFLEFLQQGDYHRVHPSIFRELDLHHKGWLDFWDVLTLYYMLKTRHVPCKGCHRTCLNGLYFTCVECFDSPGGSYDLCLPCYYQQNFQHDDHTFLDSYVLLRSKRGAANTNPPSAPQQPVNTIIQNNNPIRMAFQALEFALAAGGLASAFSSCSIM